MVKKKTSQIPLTRSRPRRQTTTVKKRRSNTMRSNPLHRRWISWTPKRRAAVSRAVKIAIYYVFGYLLAVAAFFVVYKLTSDAVDPLIVQITGFIIASITGGIHKAINWQAAGIDPNSIPTPSPDATLPAAVAIPTIAVPTTAVVDTPPVVNTAETAVKEG